MLESKFIYRLTFSKIDKMVFIGHLDLMKIFQRSIKRAKLPIAYSKGFNPHQLMSFALPLSLGTIGLAEILEIELETKLDELEITKKLNLVLPKGIYVKESRLLEPREKSAASTITSAVYEIIFPFEIKNHDQIIEDILSEKEIIVLKKTKRDEKEVDVRGDIFSLHSKVENINEAVSTIVQAHISAGSQRNLKSGIVTKIICDKACIDFSQVEARYVRVKFDWKR